MLNRQSANASLRGFCKDIWDSAEITMAFANDAGGELYLGIKENPDYQYRFK